MIGRGIVATLRALDLILPLLLDHEVNHGSRVERPAGQEHDPSTLEPSCSPRYDRISGLRDLLRRICNKGVAIARDEAIRIVLHSTPTSDAS